MREVGPADDLTAAATGLRPGDTLSLRGGLYIRDTSWFLLDLNGTPDSPIVIRNRPGETPVLRYDTLFRTFVHISQGGAGQNVVTVGRSSYLIIEGLEITGGRTGLETYFGLCHDLTIRNCHLHDLGNVGIRIASDGHYNIRCVRNHIHHTGVHGEGYYIGDSPADIPASGNPHHCEFVNNWIHHTCVLDPDGQGDGIELKSGCYAMTVRANVIHDTKNPCILSWGTRGRPVSDNNRVSGNVVFHSPDAGMQINGETDVFNNLILGGAQARRTGLAVHENQTSATRLRQVRVCNNTIYGARLRLGNLYGKDSLLFSNNAFFNVQDTAIVCVAGLDTVAPALFRTNRVGGVMNAGRTLPAGLERTSQGTAAFAGPDSFDYYPAAASELRGSGTALGWLPSFFAVDFNGAVRAGAWDIGAYQSAASQSGTPGWTLADLSGGFMDTLSPVIDIEGFFGAFDEGRPLRLSAAPNPLRFSAILTVTGLSEARKWNPVNPPTLRLFDARGCLVADLGRALRAGRSEAIAVDASGLPSGIYWARLSAGGRTAVCRLVVRR